MFNWLRKRIYKNWYHKDDPFIYFAGCYITVKESQGQIRGFAYLSDVSKDLLDETYLLMPRGTAKQRMDLKPRMHYVIAEVED